MLTTHSTGVPTPKYSGLNDFLKRMKMATTMSSSHGRGGTLLTDLSSAVPVTASGKSLL